MNILKVHEGGGESPSVEKSYFRWLMRLKNIVDRTDNPEGKKLIEKTIKSLKNIRK